jgi:hypothetical protein
MIALLGWLSPRDLDQYPAEAGEFQVAAAALPEHRAARRIGPGNTSGREASERPALSSSARLCFAKFGDVRQKAEPEQLAKIENDLREIDKTLTGLQSKKVPPNAPH